MHTIAIARTPYGNKFAIPRQPGLAESVTSTIELVAPYNVPESVTALSQFSHIWLIFTFHATAERGWHPTVRPPRLGGNKRVGVFASRATHRPNPLGLSVVKLLRVELEGGVRRRVGGGDLLDGTPILDIKPYIPFVDALPHAEGGFASTPPIRLTVHLAPALIENLPPPVPDTLRTQLMDILAYDTRPAYQVDDESRLYGAILFGLDVKWRITQNQVNVIAITPFKP